MISIADIFDDEQPRRWSGARFRVSPGDVPRGAPACHLEYERGRLRVCLRGRTLLLVRNRAYLTGVDWIRAAPPDGALELLPPQPHALARELKSDLRAWARRYAEQLFAARARVLHEGDWLLEPGAALEDARASRRRSGSGSPVPVLGLLDDRPADRGSLLWDLDGSSDTLFLRVPSPADSSRVKAARKLAREGILPPLLLWFVSELDAFVLLDGHDRLRAARLENIVPAALVLSSPREKEHWTDDEGKRAAALKSMEQQLSHSTSPATIDAVNDRLRYLYPPKHWILARTRVWPMPGGAEAWAAEARALCAEGDAPGELLAGL